jgi:hypothetical protein
MKTPQDLAKQYLELLAKATSWKKRLEVIAAWHSKHLRAVFEKKDDMKEVLKAHNVKV